MAVKFQGWKAVPTAGGRISGQQRDILVESKGYLNTALDKVAALSSRLSAAGVRPDLKAKADEAYRILRPMLDSIDKTIRG